MHSSCFRVSLVSTEQSMMAHTFKIEETYVSTQEVPGVANPFNVNSSILFSEYNIILCIRGGQPL